MTRKHDAIGSIGVTETQLAVERLGWIFRRQPENDYGIDAHVEVCEAGEVRGGLVGLQIKSGASYFTRKSADGWDHPISLEHRDYWLYGTLPVIVVLYDPATRAGYWQVVSDATVVVTGKMAKVTVPRTNTFEAVFENVLRELAAGPAWLGRFRKLALAREWMEQVAQGESMVVEFTDKVNTVVPRGSFEIHVGGRAVKSWPFYVRGLSSHEDVLEEAFPWADATIDEEFEDEKLDELYDAECSYHDDEGVTYHTVSREAFAARMEGMDPDSWMGNEFSTHRYYLRLNELGESFLTVYRHLHGLPPPDRASPPAWEGADEAADWRSDPEAEYRRTVARAGHFGFELVEEAATCTVSVLDAADPACERSIACGRPIEPGKGFKRWEMRERREVLWCWSCATEILWAGP